MPNRITVQKIAEIAKIYDIPTANFRAVLGVEANGRGFDEKTGKILIQFEPLWMLRFLGIGPGKAGPWVKNKVDNQPNEWLAFNLAYRVNKTAAMKSTSIGMGQIMGFHYARLGFATVDAFWDYCKRGECEQVEMVAKFISLNPAMYKALKEGNTPVFAYHYNGEEYKKFNYDIRIQRLINYYSDSKHFNNEA